MIFRSVFIVALLMDLEGNNGICCTALNQLIMKEWKLREMSRNNKELIESIDLIFLNCKTNISPTISWSIPTLWKNLLLNKINCIEIDQLKHWVHWNSLKYAFYRFSRIFKDFVLMPTKTLDLTIFQSPKAIFFGLLFMNM